MSDQPPGRAGVAELGWMAALVLVPAGLAGAAAAYATIPQDVVICFAVGPGFTPQRLVVGGPDAPTHLRLPG